MYQLYSYLKNVEENKNDPLTALCEGILLYPTVSYELNESFLIGNHMISIFTVDPAQHWQDISLRLKAILN